jgi:two-component system, NarL family, invasion response regulator UvrY
MKKKAITIALADDHALFREGLVQLIKQFTPHEVILSAGNGAELVAEIDGGVEPDIVISDMDMPEMTGLEVVQWLGQHRPHMPVLILPCTAAKPCLLNW